MRTVTFPPDGRVVGADAEGDAVAPVGQGRGDLRVGSVLVELDALVVGRRQVEGAGSWARVRATFVGQQDTANQGARRLDSARRAHRVRGGGDGASVASVQGVGVEEGPAVLGTGRWRPR